VVLTALQYSLIFTNNYVVQIKKEDVDACVMLDCISHLEKTNNLTNEEIQEIETFPIKKNLHL
jgi:hypothetical protein